MTNGVFLGTAELDTDLVSRHWSLANNLLICLRVYKGHLLKPFAGSQQSQVTFRL